MRSILDTNVRNDFLSQDFESQLVHLRLNVCISCVLNLKSRIQARELGI